MALPAAPGVRVLVPHAVSPRAPALGGQVHALSGRSMGTTWSVRFVGHRDMALLPVQQRIQHELDDVVAQMSPWEPDSDITRFNRSPPGRWQVLPPAFFEVLDYALAVARDSGGAYDPTAGALVDLWGFGPAPRHDEPGFELPSDAAVGAALACSGWQRLEIDSRSRRVRQPGGLRLDLSAVAKGHAVDRVARMLAETFGLRDSLVEVGGELHGSGLKPDGQPWWVDLEAVPRLGADGSWQVGANLLRTRIALHGLSVATSGDYRRFFRHAGVHHPHTLDPRSGRPIGHGLALVTVLHADCMAADALSTALTVMGVEAGLAWAEAHGLCALFVVRLPDGHLEERMTSSFAALA